MGKGKGGFDHWAARMAVNQIAFEIRGNIHEQVIRDAFRLAGQKLPGRKSLDVCVWWPKLTFMTGQWEVVKKGDPPVVGITKLANGITLDDLKRPRKKLPESKAVPIPPPAEAISTAPPPA